MPPYTASPFMALQGEPEAVSPDEQVEITRVAVESEAERVRLKLEAELAAADRDAAYHLAQLRHAERRRVRLCRALGLHPSDMRRITRYV